MELYHQYTQQIVHVYTQNIFRRPFTKHNETVPE